MAFVLCTGADPSLMATRKLIVEGAGHNVVTATSEPELIRACTENRFDVAVVGQAVSRHEKNRILSLVRRHCPAAKVLELYSPTTGKLLLDADDWLEVPAEIPSDLAERVDALSGSSRIAL